MDFLLKTRMSLEGKDLAPSSGRDSKESRMPKEAGSMPVVSLSPNLHDTLIP